MTGPDECSHVSDADTILEDLRGEVIKAVLLTVASERFYGDEPNSDYEDALTWSDDHLDATLAAWYLRRLQLAGQSAREPRQEVINLSLHLVAAERYAETNPGDAGGSMHLDMAHDMLEGALSTYTGAFTDG